jgi:hypothetical protein
MLGEILGFGASVLGTGLAYSAASDAREAYSEVSGQQLALGREQLATVNRIRDKSLARTDNLATKLQQAMEALGPFGGSYFNESELAAEQGRRYAQYRDDADRAITAAASQIKSNMIQRGMDGDRTTLSTDAAREFAPTAQRMYTDAYNKSYTDALAYISGLNSERYRGMDQMASMRTRSFGELDNVLGLPIKYESALIGNTGQGAATMISYAGAGAANMAAQAGRDLGAAGSGLGYNLGRLGREVETTDWYKNLFNSKPVYTPYSPPPSAFLPGSEGAYP